MRRAFGYNKIQERALVTTAPDVIIRLEHTLFRAYASVAKRWR